MMLSLKNDHLLESDGLIGFLLVTFYNLTVKRDSAN